MRFVALALIPTAVFALEEEPCHSISAAVDDDWCDKNCNHTPSNCPASLCECGTPTPTPGPAPGPSPPTPVPPPPPGDTQQLFTAYYSGISLNTLGQGGVNSLSLAFFSPGALSEASSCDFTDLNTPCLRPASGAGGQLGLKWAIDAIKGSASQLASNTSPEKGHLPTVFFSFGGMSEGGGAWDSAFSSASKAASFGKNAAALVKATASATSNVALIGIDLDVEGTDTTLPHIGDFISAYRAEADFHEHPLMLCTLSGIADPSSADHFKLAIMQNYGPADKGINYLNLMVDNQEPSCESMSGYWRDERLSFLPEANRLLGMWGINNAGWILHEPGCTTGDSPLYSWMKSSGAGLGIWQWWSGDPSPVAQVISQVRMGTLEGTFV